MTSRSEVWTAKQAREYFAKKKKRAESQPEALPSPLYSGRAEMIKVVPDEEFPGSIGLDDQKCIYIRGDVASSKNSHQVYFRPGQMPEKSFIRCTDKKGRSMVPFVTKSDFAKLYVRNTFYRYQKNKEKFLSLIQDKKPPYYVYFMFIRKSNARFDFGNMIQIVQDQMQSAGWIEDDDVDTLLPLPLVPVKQVIKGYEGVVIYVP